MKSARLLCIGLFAAIGMCGAAVAYEAPPDPYYSPGGEITAQDVDALSMWIDSEAKALGRIPLQPHFWGSHFDPLYTGEGVNLEFIDNGPQANLLAVGYVYTYMDDWVQTPVWAFFNELVQPAFVSAIGDPHYRFALYRTRPNGAPPDDPAGWIEFRPTPDERLAVQFNFKVHPGDNLSNVTRFWILSQLSRPPGVAPLSRCKAPGGFSPPAPEPNPYCLTWP